MSAYSKGYADRPESYDDPNSVASPAFCIFRAGCVRRQACADAGYCLAKEPAALQQQERNHDYDA